MFDHGTRIMKRHSTSKLFLLLALAIGLPALAGGRYAVAPTGQTACYGADGHVMACALRGAALSGQDAQHATTTLRYRDNGDGTVSDLNTGLMWQQATPAKLTWAEAHAGARTLRLGGKSDWRLPNIKELYSLMDFSGVTVGMNGRAIGGMAAKPYLDSRVFDFRYGDASAGERPIDAQYWSATEYTGRTMGGHETVFGVNFADGRIKGYPKYVPWNRSQGQRMFVRYVRGNPDYGKNDFADNGDGTVTDRATGLIWMQADSGALKAGRQSDGSMDWPQALAWASGLDYAGHKDWRLPNAKELQSIVDYSRSPQTTGSPAIGPLFKSTPIRDEAGRPDYASYWTSTSHLDGPRPGSAAVYISFGSSLGFMRRHGGGEATLMDVHGAGAQRSDPKQGDPAAFPAGRGPQGDVIRIYNMVRLVRGG